MHALPHLERAQRTISEFSRGYFSQLAPERGTSWNIRRIFVGNAGISDAPAPQIAGSKAKGRGNAFHGLAKRLFRRQRVRPANSSIDAAVINLVRIAVGAFNSPRFIRR